jgi:hypothetical protein
VKARTLSGLSGKCPDGHPLPIGVSGCPLSGLHTIHAVPSLARSVAKLGGPSILSGRRTRTAADPKGLMLRPIDHFLSRLTRLPNIGGRGWKFICPLADGDRDHVLKIDLTPDRLVLFCHGGCSTAAVLAAMHLRLSDLYPVRPLGRSRQGPAQSLAVKLAASGLSEGEIEKALAGACTRGG